MHVPPEDRESGSRTISFYRDRCTNTDKSTEGLSERHLLVETLALFPASNSSVASICTRVASPSIYEASNQQSNILTYDDAQTGWRRKFNLRYYLL